MGLLLLQLVIEAFLVFVHCAKAQNIDCQGPKLGQEFQIEHELLCALQCSVSENCSSYKFSALTTTGNEGRCEFVDKYNDNIISENIKHGEMKLSLKFSHQTLYAPMPSKWNVSKKAESMGFDLKLEINSLNSTRYVRKVQEAKEHFDAEHRLST